MQCRSKRCFIFVEAEVHGEADLRQGISELEICRRIVDRIATKHREEGDFAFCHLVSKPLQVSNAIALRRFSRVADGLADVPEEGIKTVRESVYVWALTGTDGYQ